MSHQPPVERVTSQNQGDMAIGFETASPPARAGVVPCVGLAHQNIDCMNNTTSFGLLTIAVAAFAATLPTHDAQAACNNYLAASVPSAPANEAECQEGSECYFYMGSVRTVAMGVNRARAQALADEAVAHDGTSSALSAPAPSSTNIACLSDAYGAPLVAQGLARTSDHLRQVLNRLEQTRIPGRAQASGLSMYLLGDSPSQKQTGTATLKVQRVDLTVGSDYRFNDAWVAGASLGWGNPRMRWSDNPIRVDGNSTNLTAYGSWSPTSASYVSAALSTEWSRYTLSSDDGIERTRDDTRARQTGLSLSAGHDFTTGIWTVSPYARVDQVTARLGNFGSTASVNKGRSGAVSAGSQVQFSLPTQWGLFVPHARLEFTRVTQWRLSGDSAATYAASAGILPSPNPLALDRQFGQFGIGASALFQRGVTVFTDYDTGFAQKGVESRRVTLGLRAEL